MTIIRDSHGQITAACEWLPVNAMGLPDNDGTHIWVEQLEVSRGAGRQAIRDVICQIAMQMPQAVAAYWTRRSRPNATVREWTRAHLFREVVEEVR